MTTTSSTATGSTAAPADAPITTGRRDRVWRRRLTGAAFPIAALVLLLLVWEAAVRYFRVPSYIAAAPTAVWAAFIKDPNYILKHTMATGIAAVAVTNAKASAIVRMWSAPVLRSLCTRIRQGQEFSSIPRTGARAGLC